MKKLHFAISLCLLLTAATAKAQYIIKEADRQYESYKYAEAIGLYEEAYNKKATLHAAERLGDCYRLNNNYAEAEKWYAIAIAMPGSKAENTLYYAKALQNGSKYAEARAQYENYAAADKNVSADQKGVWLASCDSAISWLKSPKPFDIENYSALNSGKSEWNAVPYTDGIVFTSDRFINKAHQPNKHNFILHFDTRTVPDPMLNGWTGNDYLHLFLKPSNGDSIRMFPLKTGTNYHVGSASFTKDGKEMFFTMTRIPGKRTKGKATTVNVEIFSSRQDAAGKWSDPLPFTHNNVTAYSVGDPFITEDGMALYFASNMPGGKGGSDLYVCYRTAAGEWGPPLNLQAINTAGNDRSPVLTKNNVLYFASDGRIGMGGLDIYRTVLEKAGQSAGKVRNMRFPVNSPQDDFAFWLTESGKAYLSSNRGGGLGSDDIYLISALHKDDETSPAVPAEETPVTVDTLDKVATTKPVDNDVKAPVSNVETTKPQQDTASATHPHPMKPYMAHPNMPVIYFNFGKADIDPAAEESLGQIVKLLADNPEMVIEVGSHTDSRGNDAFNQALSQKRAISVMNYLVKKGVEKSRVVAKGYGETKLLNKCGNGVLCTEEEHKVNRRTEFKIVKQ